MKKSVCILNDKYYIARDCEFLVDMKDISFIDLYKTIINEDELNSDNDYSKLIYTSDKYGYLPSRVMDDVRIKIKKFKDVIPDLLDSKICMIEFPDDYESIPRKYIQSTLIFKDSKNKNYILNFKDMVLEEIYVPREVLIREQILFDRKDGDFTMPIERPTFSQDSLRGIDTTYKEFNDCFKSKYCMLTDSGEDPHYEEHIMIDVCNNIIKNIKSDISDIVEAVFVSNKYFECDGNMVRRNLYSRVTALLASEYYECSYPRHGTPDFSEPRIREPKFSFIEFIKCSNNGYTIIPLNFKHYYTFNIHGIRNTINNLKNVNNSLVNGIKTEEANKIISNYYDGLLNVISDINLQYKNHYTQDDLILKFLISICPKGILPPEREGLYSYKQTIGLGEKLFINKVDKDSIYYKQIVVPSIMLYYKVLMKNLNFEVIANKWINKYWNAPLAYFKNIGRNHIMTALICNFIYKRQAARGVDLSKKYKITGKNLTSFIFDKDLYI